MPTVARTSAARLLEQARRLLEAGGPEAVTMHAIARAEGIRAPSLYKHFADRAALLDALVLDGFATLAAALREAASADDPLAAMARAYRDVALASPQRYLLMMGSGAPMSPAADEARRTAAAPLLEWLAPRTGPDAALRTARLFTAFVHGWVTMEITGAFRLGGDPSADFLAALEALRAVVAG